MATLSTHMIVQYFEKYCTREIAFNQSVIKITGLEPKKIFLKIKGNQASCVLYSCSMQNASIIANINSQMFNLFKMARNFINLRLSFLPPGAKSSIIFFIPTHIEGYKNFNEKNKDIYLVNLKFTKKPPDDLIEILGNLIQEKEDFEKRKDIRISLEGKIISDINLGSNKAIAITENIKRPCILRNISVSGAFALLSCIPKFIMNKKIILNIFSRESKIPITIEGIVIRYEQVGGREDIYGVAIQFIKDKIPFEYKHLINTYLDKLEGIVKRK